MAFDRRVISGVGHRFVALSGTAENVRFVDRRLLQTMKPSAILIDAARGGLVHEQDLADALASGTIAGVCLDVVSVEPIAADNPLRTARNCLLTPHIGWATVEARRRLMRTTAENIAAFLAGKPGQRGRTQSLTKSPRPDAAGRNREELFCRQGLLVRLQFSAAILTAGATQLASRQC